MLDPNNVYHTRIDRILIDIDCVNDITTGEFWSFINSTILDDMEENYSFPQCPAMTYNVITSRAKCWKVTNDHTNGICNILNCGYDGECQMFYKVCTDYTQSPVVTFRELVNSQSIDNETCSAEMPDFSDEEEFDPDEDWTTECFVISCDID